MSSFSMPDLSGTQANYRRTGKYVVLFKTGQHIDFDVPVFAESLQMFAPGDTPLHNTIDWEILDANIDYSMMSHMKIATGGFNKTLLKSITIKRAFSPNEEIPVELRFQQLYPVATLAAITNNEVVASSPLVQQEMNLRLANLEIMARPIADTGSDTDEIPTFLVLDIHRENNDNIVEGEKHQVNTYDGKSIIRPAKGAFFAAGLVLRIPDGNIPLVRDTDYILLECNFTKTALSNDPSGIHELIQITRPIAGEIELVSYHAVGGETTVEDISIVWRQLQDVKAALSGRNYVTQEALPTAPALVFHNQRIATLENQVRALMNGNQTYNDSTSGLTAVKRIRATDAKLHWWTVAKLYKVQNSDDVSFADVARYHIRLQNACLSAIVTVSGDLTPTLVAKQFAVDAAGVVQNTGFDLYNTFDPSVVVVQPRFRMVWQEGGVNPSGALLQIGLTLPTLNEILAIEDISGIETTWIMNQSEGTVQVPLTPEDNSFLLPDGTTIWNSASGNAKNLQHMMPNKSGYMVWHGAKLVTDLDKDSAVWQVDSADRLREKFLLSDIRSLQVELNDASNNYQTLHIPMSGINDTTRRGIGSFVVAGQSHELLVTLQTIDNSMGTIAGLVDGLRMTAVSSSTISGVTTNQLAVTNIIAHMR